MYSSQNLLVSFLLLKCSAIAQEYCTPAVKAACSGTASACLEDTCSSDTSSGNEDFQSTMLDGHNRYRADPFESKYGGDMIEMIWDAQLEDTALRWAQSLCSNNAFKHDDGSCRKTPDYSSVGQNIWKGSGSAYGDLIESGNAAMTSWIKENATISSSDLSSFSGSAGHYTQMMWAKSFALGCAAVVKGQDAYVVCNYAPAGNMNGEKVFEASDALGTNCPDGTTKGSSGLCSISDKDALRTALNVEKTT